MDTDWTATALFSPSKARVQQAQAKDWAAVDAWIAKRYGSRMPAYERNEETLQALLALANINETADEQRSHVDRIEKVAFQALSKRNGGIADEVFPAMLSELASETHLDTLAESMVALQCPTADAVEMGKHMIDLTAATFETNQQAERAEAQLNALKIEQSRLKKLLQELTGGDFQAPPDVADNTAEWARSTKQLKAKVAEYEERLASRPATATASIGMVQSRLETLTAQRTQLAEMQRELDAFQNLPSDSRAARVKVEEARNQLRKLMTQRDRMFESLVET